MSNSYLIIYDKFENQNLNHKSQIGSICQFSTCFFEDCHSIVDMDYDVVAEVGSDVDWKGNDYGDQSCGHL